MNGTEQLGDEERYRAVLEISVEALEPLIAALHDESWRVRKVAVERLGQAPARERTVVALLAVLKERGVPGARNAAAEALVLLGASAEPAAVGLLSDPDPDQRKFAAEILGQIRRPSSEPALIAALEDPDLNVRVSAAEALTRLGGDGARRALERALNQDDPVVQLSALEGLVTLRKPPPMPELVALLRQPALQRSAFRALGLIPQPAAVELVCRGLSSDVRSVREAALSALGLQWNAVQPERRAELASTVASALRHVQAMQPLVISALESDDLEVKAGALLVASALKDNQLAVPVAEAACDDRLVNEVGWALLRLGPDAARSLLEGMYSLSAPARAAAGEALVALADPSWVVPLSFLLQSGEDELALLAIRVLGRTGSVGAIPPLMRALGEKGLEAAAARALTALGSSFREEVKAALEAHVTAAPTPAAVWGLAKVAGPEALPLLRRTVKDADAAVRAASAEAACEVGEADCLEIARLAISDEAGNVRAAAVRSLARLTRPEVVVLLERGLSDEELQVQLEAIDGVGECGERGLPLTPRLEAWAGDPDGRRASRAVRALGRMGALSGAVLLTATAHPDPEVVKEALLQGAGMREGVGAAARLLSHGRWDVRVAAARVLGSGGDRTALVAVQEQLTREEDPSALEALREAEARLRDR